MGMRIAALALLHPLLFQVEKSCSPRSPPAGRRVRRANGLRPLDQWRLDNAACRPLVDPTRFVRTLLPAFGLTALLPPQRQRAQARACFNCEMILSNSELGD